MADLAVLARAEATDSKRTTFEQAVQNLLGGGADAAGDLLDGLAGGAWEPSDDALLRGLAEVVSLAIAMFERDPCSADAYRLLKRFHSAAAESSFHHLMKLRFPDGEIDLNRLNNVSVICLSGLMSVAGAHDNAIGFLSEIMKQRGADALRQALWFARCQKAGCSEDIASFFRKGVPIEGDLEFLQEQMIAAPLNPAAHSAIIRRLAAEGNLPGSWDALGVGLSLPVPDDDKMVLGEDLAILVSVLIAQGREALLQKQRLRWALAACSAVRLHAIALIEQSEFCARLPFLDDEMARRARDFLDRCSRANSSVLTPELSPFPVRNGKPYVDIVWLEITNFCNQKCGFCPDPSREEPRSWMPLDQIKRLIDELAETISVGSTQLNAYGEPLLHPHIAEILSYLREKQLPWPTYFTSHGLTLVDKKLKQLSHNYPAGIAISLHNDSQASYAATRSAKIGDYDTLVARVASLMRQMAFERAPSHLRLYQMVCNGDEAKQVNPEIRAAFPNTPERMKLHVRSWEKIAAEIAASAPAEAEVRALVNPDDAVEAAFRFAAHSDKILLPILRWKDPSGRDQEAFISARPVGTYANLLLEYDPKWTVKRQVVNPSTCGFTAKPSLAIFATGRLGICCLDLNSTATFGALSDYGNLHEALTSPEALRMFAQLSNGIASSRGCQICLGTGKQVCAA